MQKVTIIIEQASDGYYWCRTTEDISGAGLNSCGATVEEAKQDLENCFRELVEELQQQGKKAPKVEFLYKYDLRSFFNYFNFLNVSEIAKRAGINPSLMAQYNGGFKKAGEKTYKRLSECIERIKKELQASSF